MLYKDYEDAIEWDVLPECSLYKTSVAYFTNMV